MRSGGQQALLLLLLLLLPCTVGLSNLTAYGGCNTARCASVMPSSLAGSISKYPLPYPMLAGENLYKAMRR